MVNGRERNRARERKRNNDEIWCETVKIVLSFHITILPWMIDWYLRIYRSNNKSFLLHHEQQCCVCVCVFFSLNLHSFCFFASFARTALSLHRIQFSPLSLSLYFLLFPSLLHRQPLAVCVSVYVRVAAFFRSSCFTSHVLLLASFALSLWLVLHFPKHDSKWKSAEHRKNHIRIWMELRKYTFHRNRIKDVEIEIKDNVKRRKRATAHKH